MPSSASASASRSEASEMTFYSVGAAIDSMGWGRFQVMMSMIAGFAYMADAMEMMILSILGPALHCQWNISEYEQASMTTVVFLGMLLSSSAWGVLADKHGRRVAMIIATVFLFYFGFVSSFAPTFKWMLFLRFIVGIFIGGIPQIMTLYAEYLPTKQRGKAILVMSFFWAFGALFEALLAWITMTPALGWRYLVAFSCIPLLIFLLFSNHIPESPMYLAITGQKQQVERQLNRVARWNNKPVIHGNLVLDDSVSSMSSRGNVLDLFRGPTGIEARITGMVMGLWFIAAVLYYGVVLISTELLNSSANVCQHIEKHYGEDVCSVKKCSGLTGDDYQKLILTTLAEFPGTFLALLLIDRLGRKKTLALQSAIFAVSMLCLVECGESREFIVLVLFTARGVAAGFFQTVYVYTPEVYQTKLRALAMGTHSAFARIGAMITPYIAQVMLKASLYYAIAVYVLLGIVATLLALLLPVETVGQILDDAGSPSRSIPGGTTTSFNGAAASKSDKEGLVEQMEENEKESEQAKSGEKERY